MFILRKMNVIQPVRFSFKIVVTSRLFAYIPFNLLIRVIIRYYCSPTTRRIFNVTFAGIFFRRVFIRIGKYISQYLDKSLQFKLVAILKIAHVFEYRQDKKFVEERNIPRLSASRGKNPRLRNARRRPPRDLLRPERDIRGNVDWAMDASLWFRRYLRRPRFSRFHWTSFLSRVVQGYDTHTWRAANIRKQGAAKCVEIDPRFLDPRFSLFRIYKFTVEYRFWETWGDFWIVTRMFDISWKLW